MHTQRGDDAAISPAPGATVLDDLRREFASRGISVSR
jgi:hypothetical protein